MITLGIESSCDDTAVAIIRGSREVLSEHISSQIAEHQLFGGVVPEFAARMHQEAILPLIKLVMDEASMKVSETLSINLIAVTCGPGLVGSLMVGVLTARALGAAWNVPVTGVNHIEGHIFANFIADETFVPPFICLVVSGGHTEIILTRAWGDYVILGGTRDDAAGEAFDKAAKLLGLPYPGGAVIDNLSVKGNPKAYSFPIPLKNTDEIEFSFSGLKTALLWKLKQLSKENMTTSVENNSTANSNFSSIVIPRQQGGGVGDVHKGTLLSEASVFPRRRRSNEGSAMQSEASVSQWNWNLNDICASYQAAIVESLMVKLELAVKKTGINKVAISGGVAANSALRAAVQSKSGEWDVYIPPIAHCTDNAAMIAAAGAAAWLRGVRMDAIAPDPSLRL